MTPTKADQIIYFADPLPGDRAQPRRDVVIDGVIVPELSGTIGSPGPAVAVRAHERTVALA